MINRSVRSPQKSIGVLLKHVLGICLLSGFLFWLIHYINHSHGTRNMCSMNFTGYNNICSPDGPDWMLKLGRKDIRRFPQVLDEHEQKYEYKEEKSQEEANQQKENKNGDDGHQEEAHEHEDGDYEDTVDKHDQYIDNVENYDIVEDYDNNNSSEDENESVETKLGNNNVHNQNKEEQTEEEEANNNGYYDDDEDEEEATEQENENEVGIVIPKLEKRRSLKNYYDYDSIFNYNIGDEVRKAEIDGFSNATKEKDTV